ncbi:hypothetical protein Q8G31_27600 [Priestia megaterium]|uniref:hypothetical protein n=1 Tax=Priestia megaterium TaxID=1404 RepID=UPI002730C5C7|nr:hypothetical protein [Priestia megaterium]MDP1383469.1 hypothetical protein [Priestia megaterium]MDP1427619.1 hypothetical protein [Priestia megaterium]
MKHQTKCVQNPLLFGFEKTFALNTLEKGISKLRGNPFREDYKIIGEFKLNQSGEAQLFQEKNIEKYEGFVLRDLTVHEMLLLKEKIHLNSKLNEQELKRLEQILYENYPYKNSLYKRIDFLR